MSKRRLVSEDEGPSKRPGPDPAERAGALKALLVGLNEQFASWVAQQHRDQPAGLLTEGARSYITHITELLHQYKDVLSADSGQDQLSHGSGGGAISSGNHHSPPGSQPASAQPSPAFSFGGGKAPPSSSPSLFGFPQPVGNASAASTPGLLAGSDAGPGSGPASPFGFGATATPVPAPRTTTLSSSTPASTDPSATPAFGFGGTAATSSFGLTGGLAAPGGSTAGAGRPPLSFGVAASAPASGDSLGNGSGPAPSLSLFGSSNDKGAPPTPSLTFGGSSATVAAASQSASAFPSLSAAKSDFGDKVVTFAAPVNPATAAASAAPFTRSTPVLSTGSAAASGPVKFGSANTAAAVAESGNTSNGSSGHTKVTFSLPPADKDKPSESLPPKPFAFGSAAAAPVPAATAAPKPFAFGSAAQAPASGPEAASADADAAPAKPAFNFGGGGSGGFGTAPAAGQGMFSFGSAVSSQPPAAGTAAPAAAENDDAPENDQNEYNKEPMQLKLDQSAGEVAVQMKSKFYYAVKDETGKPSWENRGVGTLALRVTKDASGARKPIITFTTDAGRVLYCVNVNKTMKLQLNDKTNAVLFVAHWSPDGSSPPTPQQVQFRTAKGKHADFKNVVEQQQELM